MTMVVASLLEIANDHPVLLVLMVLALASMGGGVPPMIERRRRRAIERGLPTLLESLSDSIGAGLGLQQAMKAQADSNDRLGALIHAALEDGRSSTFEASLASLGIRSRSPQVQRVVNLITTALKQDAPLKDLLYSLSQDYDRLNQLMDRRETELSGYSMMMIMLIGFGLPGLIAFIVGLFTPASSGYQVLEFHRVFALFFAAASAITVGISGRMLGRFRDMAWFLPAWCCISMSMYIGAATLIGG